MEYYLLSQKILFKDFKTYRTGLTNRVRACPTWFVRGNKETRREMSPKKQNFSG